MIVLGIDVGTSSVKAALVDVANDCSVLASSTATYPIDQPEPDAAEVRSEELLAAISKAVSGAVTGRGNEVAGIGLSCLTPALCLLDAADQPLEPFPIHLDRRARATARVVMDEVGQEFLDTVGTKPLPGGISAVNALSRKRQGVKRYLHLNSWLAFHLTGQTAFDPGNASFTGLWNTLTDQQWSPRWCDFFGVEMEWLPEVVDGATTIGGLRKHIAEQWGIRRDIPVKLGTADTSCGMIAAGLQIEELYHSVGTTQVLAALTPHPRPGWQRLTRHFGVGSLFMQIAHNPVGGVALPWLHKLCFADMMEAEFFSDVIPEATKRTTNVRLDPPFLGGDRLQLEECTAALSALTLNVDRLDIVSAVLRAMREGHEAALRDLGVHGPFRRIVLAGGGGDLARELHSELDAAAIEVVHDGAVRGAAKLFALRQM